ncbi:RNA polymerase factor sigma-54 [Herpetosiphon gulosus]|uniref:RNA polymerase sigma-54 factor n=1 Tax=Herpetosiphon gulosus TaxID=1973496 RepID=A0ABP9X4X9_9CHLR
MEFRMGMSPEALAQQAMSTKASPALIALNNMLVLSTHELQQLIQQELEENPALENVDLEPDETCSRCGRPLIEMLCLYCVHEDQRLAEAERGDYTAAGEDDEFDPLMMVATPAQLSEVLLRDLRASLPEQDYFIAEYLVGCLDDQGFLDANTADIAATLTIDEERVIVVLLKLQDIAPVGVGARDVQECLLLQLRRLAEEDVHHPYVERVITEFWNDLAEHRYGAIAQALNAEYDDVVGVREFIREHLRPYPLALSGEGSARTNYIMPDVIIRENEGKLEAEVLMSDRSFLRINPLYQSLVKRGREAEAEMSSEDRDHLSQYVARAQMFLTNIRQRRETIRRISEFLIETQEDFLRQGVRFLRPMTRAEVADGIGVHESTVSRATANKYVQLPNRSVIPFSHFFTASLNVKDVLLELVQNEVRPLTDQELVELLAERGFDVARRTIAKYRNQLNILPSTLR